MRSYSSHLLVGHFVSCAFAGSSSAFLAQPSMLLFFGAIASISASASFNRATWHIKSVSCVSALDVLCLQ